MKKKKKEKINVISAFNAEFYLNCRGVAPAYIMKSLVEGSLGRAVTNFLWLLNIEMEQIPKGRRRFRT